MGETPLAPGFFIHLKVETMSGSIEYGQCDICKKDANLNRKVYYYPVKCECHSPQHFEIVRHCDDCEPVEPGTTAVYLKTNHLSDKWAHLRLQPRPISHPPAEIYTRNERGDKIKVIGEGESMNGEDIWQQLERFTGSIRDEIKSDDPSEVSIDFWLFKIDRRVQILKNHISKEK